MSTQLNFDELLPGTVLTNQYQSKGIVFEGGLVIKDPFAPSPGNSVSVTLELSGGEFPEYGIRGTFSDPHHSHVAISAGTTNPVDGSAHLNVHDSTGNEIGSTFISIEHGFHYAFGEVFSSKGDIASFLIQGYRGTFETIDNVIFDNTTGPQQPDFRLLYTGDIFRLGNAVEQGTVQVVRLKGSNGDVQLTASNVPPGVHVDIVPNFVGGTQSSFTLRVSAIPGTAPFQNRQFQIIGTPASPSAGPAARSVAIIVTVLDSYDVQVVGIEVTQSIQVYDLPRKADPLSSGPVSYKTGSWVNLVEDDLTIVRVFSTIRTFPTNTELPNFEVTLSGSRNGVDLPHSPLQPVNGLSLAVGSDFVTDTMRADRNGSAIFNLPAEWTKGIITLTAAIQPAVTFIPYDNVDAQPQNNRFILTDIPFVPTRDLYFAPFSLSIDSQNGGYTNYPDSVLDGAHGILPIGAHQAFAGDYSGTIDITDIYNQNTQSCGFFGLSSCPLSDVDRGGIVADRLRSYADDMNYTDSGELVMGMFAGSAGPRIRSLQSQACTGPFWDCDELAVAVVQDSDRPLSSVAHELGHMLGRKHASGAGGADKPEDWPPDQKGFLEGVGYDRNSGRILFQDRTGGGLGGPFYDIMGYLGINGGNDPDKWISIRGWNENLSYLTTGPPNISAAVADLFVSSKATPTLTTFTPAITHKMDGPIDGIVIHARINSVGEGTITKIAPTFGRKPSQGKPSKYQIVVQDRQSKPLYTVSPVVVTGDIHHANDIFFLETVVHVSDWNALGAVEIHRDNQAIVRRERLKASPAISNITLTPPSESDPAWHVVWTSTHPTGNPLTSKIDYSWDGGSTYRTIYSGPDKGVDHQSVFLPAGHFPTSDNALLRIRVSDGFNFVSAVSVPFKSPGVPPTIRIIQPKRCSAYRAGCAIFLQGSGHDEMRLPIMGKNLKWFVGKKQVASGSTATLAGKDVQEGLMMIRLEAEDEREKESVATVEIMVGR